MTASLTLLPTLWRRVDKPVCQTTQLSRKEEEKEREGTEERGKGREREKPVPCQLRGRLCVARRAGTRRRERREEKNKGRGSDGAQVKLRATGSLPRRQGHPAQTVSV
ncbi:unnamed protein product [Leuciscus chuanchicus]